MTNKAIVVKAFSIENPVSNLEVVEKQIPEPKEGEVLVKITLRPVRYLQPIYMLLWIQDSMDVADASVFNMLSLGPISRHSFDRAYLD